MKSNNIWFCSSDLYLEWLLAIAFVGGIAAPLNYRWVSDSVGLILPCFFPCLSFFSVCDSKIYNLKMQFYFSAFDKIAVSSLKSSKTYSHTPPDFLPFQIAIS
jgi:hypothetical protein